MFNGLFQKTFKQVRVKDMGVPGLLKKIECGNSRGQ